MARKMEWTAGYSRGRCDYMELQNERNRDFLRKLKGDREVHFESLAEVLSRFVSDRFHEYEGLLQEELQKDLDLLKDETVQRMSDFSGCEEFKENILSHGLERFVDEKIAETVSVFEEKKRLCAKMICDLTPDSYVEYQPEWEAFENAGFRIGGTDVLEFPWSRELQEIQELKSEVQEEVSQTEDERREAEAGFQELMRQNAAERSELENKKPQIQYITKTIRREGFLGFLKDLFGKPQTETIADDRELTEWQKQVEAVQDGYDKRAREWNEKLEAIKEKQGLKKAEYSRLEKEQREMEDRIRNQLEDKVKEELEYYLRGKGGLADRLKETLERDMRQSAEEVGKLAGKACQDWSLGW